MPSEAFLNRPGSVWEQFPFAGKTLCEIRQGMERFVLDRLRSYPDVTWEEGNCGNQWGKWLMPACTPRGVLFYVHGGGFTLGSSGIPMPFLLELCHRLGVKGFSLDYRLAPEHPFPAATEDVLDAYRGLLALGYAPERIILAGESAGASLVLALLHQLRDAALPMPGGVVAMSPVTDACPELDRSDTTVLDALPDTDEVWQQYAPGADLTDPRISPARGDLSGFPPVFLFAGGAEPLLDDALRYAERASRAGVDVRMHIGQDMIHTYPLDLWDYPEAMEAFEEIELFIRQRLR